MIRPEAGGFPPGRLWGLLEMQELLAIPFMGAVTELRTLIVLTQGIQDKSKQVGQDDREKIYASHIDRLIDALEKTWARSAMVSASRLKNRLTDTNITLTYNDVVSALDDIESRFADHLSDIKLLILHPQEASLFEPADSLLATANVPVDGFSRAFPNASFEIEEAAKCIALGRHTAAVFHCMRAIEHGIKALAKSLDVPDPTKAAEKNWGIILKAVRDAIDQKWPKQSRLPNSTGAKLESLYATLDAIKNPWRNATMHVETIYAPHEALHIARCTGIFMLELMRHSDEDGVLKESSPAGATVGEAS